MQQADAPRPQAMTDLHPLLGNFVVFLFDDLTSLHI